MQRKQPGQTPPFNPMGGGRQAMMPPQQTLRTGLGSQVKQTPPYNPNQRQFEMMGGQKVPVLNSQPQNQVIQKPEWQGEDFNYNNFNRTGINDPNATNMGPFQDASQQLDPIHQELKPLEGEFIPSEMAEGDFGLYAPEGNYGLAGAEEAITTGLGAQAGALATGTYDAMGAYNRGADQGRSDINNYYDQGVQSLRSGIETGRGDINQASQGAIDRFNPYAETGGKAFDIEAARSGALGYEAQQEAFANYTESPGQQWLREQQEQAVIRNQASTGGSQSGNVLTALQEQAAGRASQNFQTDLGNLRSLATRGQDAAGNQAQIQSQAGRDLAQMSVAGGQQEMSLRQTQGDQLATMANQLGVSEGQLANQLGINLSNIYGTAGTNISSLRDAAGRDIANQINSTGTNVANLQSGLGSNLSGLDTGTSAALARLDEQSGAQTSGLRTQLATILSNLATGQGSQQSNLALQQGNAQAAGVTNSTGNTISTLTGLLASNPELLTSLIPSTTPPPATPYKASTTGPVP